MWHKSIWITRKGVERMLGIDNSKVRRMQKSGDLPFVRDEHGVCRFPRKEIELIAIAQGRIGIAAPGHVTGKAFTFFAQGKTWQEVVILLDQHGMGQTADVVRALHAQFRDRDKRRMPEVLAREPASPKRGVVDDNHSTGIGEREADEVGPADDPELAAWQREQDEAHRQAQAAFDREQAAWDEERRHRFDEATRHLAGPSSPAANDGALPPVGEQLVTLVELLTKRGAR